MSKVSLLTAVTAMQDGDLLYLSQDDGSGGYDSKSIAYSDFAPGILYTKKVTVASADVLTSNSTPVELIAAPGAGLFIIPVEVILAASYNSATYATNTILELTMDGVSNTWAQSNVLGFSAAITISINKRTATSGITYANNAAFMFQTQTGDPTAGDSDLIFYITYKIAAL
jgi:hypothetical protein